MNDVAQNSRNSIERGIDIICDTPTLLILESAWFGIRRFDEFQQKTGLMKATVSARLKKLIKAGVFKKAAYCEKPVRYEYIFTEMGLDLFPVALLMLRWEQTWSDQTGRIQVQLSHNTCNHKNITPVCSCSQCHKEIYIKDVEHTIGTNTSGVISGYTKRRRQAGLSQKTTVLFDEISKIFGDRWLSLIIRAAFLGVRRYDKFQSLTNISSNILINRLNLGIEKELFSKKPYQQKPERFEYMLTDKAYDLYPILLFLVQWSEKWFTADHKNSLTLKHKLCEKKLVPKVTCSNCKSVLTINNTSFTTAFENT